MKSSSGYGSWGLFQSEGHSVGDGVEGITSGWTIWGKTPAQMSARALDEGIDRDYNVRTS
jgi:hypothetical protein